MTRKLKDDTPSVRSAEGANGLCKNKIDISRTRESRLVPSETRGGSYGA